MKKILTSLTSLWLCGLVASAQTTRNDSPGVNFTWGLHTLDAIAKDPQNVVIPIAECRYEGFEFDLQAEYRAPSARRTGQNGRIIATVPVAGTFYPAFIFYDGPGLERIGIYVDGVQRGIAVAADDDNRQHLFFLTEAHTFSAGSQIELRALTSDGIYRTEDLLLLRHKPPAKIRTYAITDVQARSSSVEAGRANVSLTWITNWLATCQVEWAQQGSAAAFKRIEADPTNNHRVLLAGLRSNRVYRYRISATGRDGKPTDSRWREFRTSLPPVAATAKRERVPLTFINPYSSHGGANEQVQLPVTSGIPFPKGTLASIDNLRLVDLQGRELSLQATPLGRWQDGSLKWVLLDSQVKPDLSTRSLTHFLEYGTQVQRRHPASLLRITDMPERVVVSTGPLEFSVQKKRSGIIDSIRVGGEEITAPRQPSAFYLVSAEGTEYATLAPPEEVVIEERGPLRAVLRISGHFRSPDGRSCFNYTVRIHAFAGQRYLRIQHTFGNDVGSSEFTSVRSMSLGLPLAGAASREIRWALGGGESQSGALHGEEAVQLTQKTDDRYTIEVNGKAVTGGRRAEGWAEWSDGARAVTLAVRDFWQNYPKQITVRPAGLELQLCPPLGQDDYAGANGTMDGHRLYYYLRNGVYKFRQGVTKTHDIWIDFAVAPSSRSIFRSQLPPLLAVAPPSWYSASKTFGDLAKPATRGVVAEYNAFFRRFFQEYLDDRERNREYGMLNFGDWWGEAEDISWGNSEYDSQHAFLQQFVRTGDPRLFLAAEQIEWHNRDVDTVHFHVNQDRIGGVYRHCIGHVGDYYKESPEPGRGIGKGPSPLVGKGVLDVAHAFIEGHLDYYFLTGDPRSLETAKEIAERFDTLLIRNYDFGNCRVPGWHLILTIAMYNATCDPFYLNAAKIIVDRVLERQSPDGGWKRQLVPGHCECIPRHLGEASFMTGVLLTGLRMYYQATADERVAQSIVKGARYLIADTWLPRLNAFRYTSCPKTDSFAWQNLQIFDGLVYAYKLRADPKLREVLIRGTEPSLRAIEAERANWAEEDGVGRVLTVYSRATPQFIEYLSRVLAGGDSGAGIATRH